MTIKKLFEELETLVDGTIPTWMYRDLNFDIDRNIVYILLEFCDNRFRMPIYIDNLENEKLRNAIFVFVGEHIEDAIFRLYDLLSEDELALWKSLQGTFFGEVRVFPYSYNRVVHHTLTTFSASPPGICMKTMKLMRTNDRKIKWAYFPDGNMLAVAQETDQDWPMEVILSAEQAGFI